MNISRFKWVFHQTPAGIIRSDTYSSKSDRGLKINGFLKGSISQGATKMWEMRGRVSATFLKALWPKFHIYGKNRRMRGRERKEGKWKTSWDRYERGRKKYSPENGGETPLQQSICFSSHSPPPPSSSSHCDTARNFPYFKSPKSKAKPSRIPPLFPPKISFDFYSALPPISLGGGGETMGGGEIWSDSLFLFRKMWETAAKQ